MKKGFVVHAYQSARLRGKKIRYLLQLDFRDDVVHFVKPKGDITATKSYSFVSCIQMKRGETDTELTLTFGHESPYTKTVWFLNNSERGMFIIIIVYVSESLEAHLSTDIFFKKFYSLEHG
jgi:hypothetical protein